MVLPREIWPSIKRSLPEAELHIYGAYETEKARQLDSAKLGIHMKGRAENALETLERYRVNHAPLRYGAGQKGKVLDGWMSGTPTVATPIAAESMNGLIEWGCAVTNDPEQFAETAARVYCDAMLGTPFKSRDTKFCENAFVLINGGWLMCSA